MPFLDNLHTQYLIPLASSRPEKGQAAESVSQCLKSMGQGQEGEVMDGWQG